MVDLKKAQIHRFSTSFLTLKEQLSTHKLLSAKFSQNEMKRGNIENLRSITWLRKLSLTSKFFKQQNSLKNMQTEKGKKVTSRNN
ncbi:hypothetical protein F511_07101 [Dorcoceras hygrometricum]|nr:hypothetical protein F511_07101 [Dorcoceras hygrometricum]